MTQTGLKIIAAVSMILDHAVKTLPVQQLLFNVGIAYETSYVLLQALALLGRIAFPIYAFCIAEGCRYTRSPNKYMLRLLCLALISIIPYSLALDASHSLPTHWRGSVHNVLFTLLLGSCTCFIIDWLRSKTKLLATILILPLILLLAEWMGCEYGAFGILLIVSAYCLRSRVVVLTAYALQCVIFYLFIATGMTAFTGNLSAWLFACGSFLGVLCLCFYNGKRGGGSKAGFYILYPTHLCVLYVLRLLSIRML